MSTNCTKLLAPMKSPAPLPLPTLTPLNLMTMKQGYTQPSTRPRTVHPKRNGLMSMHIPIPGLSTRVPRALLNHSPSSTPLPVVKSQSAVKSSPPIVSIYTADTVSHKPKGQLLCVKGHVYKDSIVSRPLTILIDTGFTGTILISDRLAHRLHYHTIPSHCPIKLAEGTTASTIIQYQATAPSLQHKWYLTYP